MQTYEKHPSRDSDQRDEPLQLVTGMSTLMGFFSKNDVKAFILFSKRFANKDIPLSSLTDEEARDTITRILKQKAKYIGLMKLTTGCLGIILNLQSGSQGYGAPAPKSIPLY
jgi:hypothetical protein